MSIADDVTRAMGHLFDGTMAPGTDFVQSISLVHRTVSAHNAATGAPTVGTSSETINATVRGYTVEEVVAGAGLIVQGDMRFGILASTVASAPETDDQITWNSKTFRIVRVESAEFDGSNLAYICQGRQVA